MFAASTVRPTPPLPPPSATIRCPSGRRRRTGPSTASSRNGRTSVLFESDTALASPPRRDRHFLRVRSLLQLCVTVGQIGEVQERAPVVPRTLREREPQHRVPLRSERPAQEVHPRRVRRTPALAEVAGDARADDVLPGGAA